MKIFLSWSGNESKQLATIFKEWLPNVLQFVDPYMSAKDISLGERWNNSITGNLHESTFGLIFVTPTNINAPWINYEAGALSKTLDSKVVPILYNADVMILNEGPLKQFQSAKNLEKESIFSLLQSINNANNELKLDEQRLEKAFDMWWEKLDDCIKGIDKDTVTEGDSGTQEPSEKEILSVIYSKLTEQEKYFRMNNSNNKNHRNDDTHKIPNSIIRELDQGLSALEMCKDEIMNGPYEVEFKESMEDNLFLLNNAVSYLKQRTNFDEKTIEGKKYKTKSLF